MPAISARVTSACPAHTTGDSPIPVTPSSVSISTRTDCSAVVPWPLRRQLDRYARRCGMATIVWRIWVTFMHGSGSGGDCQM